VTDVPAVAELFRLPPEQFTAARNRLVAELRRAGKLPAAAAIATLPRPTPVVWAINQVAHEDGDAVARLLTTAEQLKRAQLGRTSQDVPSSVKAYRDTVTALVERSLAHLRAAGRPTTVAVRNRLTGTLMAAAIEPRLHQPLREGQLSREQTVTGFDAFGDVPPSLRVVKPFATAEARDRQPTPRTSTPREDPGAACRQAEARVRLETARAQLAQAERRARELTNAAAERAKEVAEAQQRAAAADRAAAQGQADVAMARAKVKEAEKAIRER
jgi:hypothetical protein